MKKNIYIIIVLTGILLSCNDRLDIKQDYDFDITHLPYKSKDVEFGEQVEIRFQIKSIDGAYINTKYYVRYFQFEGNGFLTDEEARAFFPNDLYELSKKTFRLYFQPNTGETHLIVLTYLDSWGHEKEVELSFTTPQKEQE